MERKTGIVLWGERLIALIVGLCVAPFNLIITLWLNKHDKAK